MELIKMDSNTILVLYSPSGISATRLCRLVTAVMPEASAVVGGNRRSHGGQYAIKCVVAAAAAVAGTAWEPDSLCVSWAGTGEFRATQRFKHYPRDTERRAAGGRGFCMLKYGHYS